MTLVCFLVYVGDELYSTGYCDIKHTSCNSDFTDYIFTHDIAFYFRRSPWCVNHIRLPSDLGETLRCLNLHVSEPYMASLLVYYSECRASSQEFAGQ